ncbi:hypothetical protein J2S42_007584 [Catenuloplanes indicus]|uniref:Uncharacterized protein n=1 Tax=Catenuloplanes indicus TaxID=137267 RepID=A0AAE3W9F6_9ACTN|nr:hypothetical protein [Catenuloplanes indicus]
MDDLIALDTTLRAAAPGLAHLRHVRETLLQQACTPAF